MIWVRRFSKVGAVAGALLLLVMALLIWIAETSSAQEVGTPISVNSPDTVNRAGSECVATWSVEWCESGAAIALCESRVIFCDVSDIESRPTVVGGWAHWIESKPCWRKYQ